MNKNNANKENDSEIIKEYGKVAREILKTINKEKEKNKYVKS